MEQTLDFLTRHGYMVLFVWVVVERLGLPLPAIPILLAAGALARAGQMNLAWVLGLTVTAALVSDLVLYTIGRRRGPAILRWLCRVSLEPDSCVRRTEETFARHGAHSLVVAKFIPALSIAPMPLAGMLGMRVGRFLLYDAMGTLLWASVFVGLGFAFSRQLGRLAEMASTLGGWLLVIVLLALGFYLAWKYAQRRRFIRDLRMARITPDDLNELLEKGEDVTIVDLRHAAEFEADPETLPGAAHIPMEELHHRHHEIPQDREIVLYCT